jgi:thioredoxin 2
MNETIHVTDENFEKVVLGSPIPVIVDFWAPWCGPCRMMAPAFEQAAEMLGPKARLLKLNVDEEPGPAARYGVRSIPTLILFRKGEPVARTAGAMDARRLVAWTERAL